MSRKKRRNHELVPRLLRRLLVSGKRILRVSEHCAGSLGSVVAIAFAVVMVFAGMFPRVMISTLDPDWSLTIYNASSSLYTLQTMTWVALLIPVVLAYVAYVWWSMDNKKITVAEVTGTEAKGLY